MPSASHTRAAIHRARPGAVVGCKARAGAEMGGRGAGHRGLFGFARARSRTQLDAISRRDAALEGSGGEHRLRRHLRPHRRTVSGAGAATQIVDWTAAGRRRKWQIRVERLHSARSAPAVVQPPEGFVATANDNVIAPNYPYHIGYEWSAPYRVHRIQELLRAGSRNGQKLDLDAMTRIQTDVISLAAQTLLTLLRP